MFLPKIFIGGLLLTFNFKSRWAHLGSSQADVNGVSLGKMAINYIPRTRIWSMVVQKSPITCSVPDTVYSVKIGK